jgi:hypothetical protein
VRKDDTGCVSRITPMIRVKNEEQNRIADQIVVGLRSLQVQRRYWVLDRKSISSQHCTGAEHKLRTDE